MCALLADLDAAALAAAVVGRQHNDVVVDLEEVLGLGAPELPAAQPRSQPRVGIARVAVDPREAKELAGPPPLHLRVVNVERGAPVTAAPILVDGADQVDVARGHARRGILDLPTA